MSTVTIQDPTSPATDKQRAFCRKYGIAFGSRATKDLSSKRRPPASPPGIPGVLHACTPSRLHAGMPSRSHASMPSRSHAFTPSCRHAITTACHSKIISNPDGHAAFFK
jgi:hypothetical protein